MKNYESLSDYVVADSAVFVAADEEFEIYLDDIAVNNDVCGYFFDKAFKRIKLPVIGAGEHTITLKCRYRNDFELENCYITGDFGVSEKRRLIARPDKINPGDIGKQGFYHYAGTVSYDFECSIDKMTEGKIYLDICGFDGICAEAEINGVKLALPWRSDATAEISRYLKCGRNEIRIRICAGLRNMLGPFHLKGKPAVTKDKSFCASGNEYTPEYVTVRTGLNKARLIF